MSTSHLPSRQQRRQHPYTTRSRPENSPTSKGSFRATHWTDAYAPEYLFNGFSTYPNTEKTRRIGSVASFAVPASGDEWSVPPITPQAHGNGRYFAHLIVLADRAFNGSQHERQNFRDLLEGNIFCYGISRTGPDTWYAHWCEIARVCWTNPVGEQFPHLDIILSRYVTKFRDINLAPIGRLCEPAQRLYEEPHIRRYLQNEYVEQRVWNLPDPQAIAPTADEPITVDDTGASNTHAA